MSTSSLRQRALVAGILPSLLTALVLGLFLLWQHLVSLEQSLLDNGERTVREVAALAGQAGQLPAPVGDVIYLAADFTVRGVEALS